jgi:5-methyltetrahydrofolate--homocysteine methyltransferase
MSLLTDLEAAIKVGNRADAVAHTENAIKEKLPPQEIIDAMVEAMDDVGQRFKANKIFVPEMLIASRAMKESLVLLEPILIEAGITPDHTAVIGTVQGDLHDIGKNLVGMMWRGANFNVVDLGTNVTPEQFVDGIREHNADIVGLSALLTTTMPSMKSTIEAIRETGIDNVSVFIGGAPVTKEYAEEIGADGYAPDAASAVDVVRQNVSA